MEQISHPSRRLGLVATHLAANLTLASLILAPIIVLDWERFSRSMSEAHAPDIGTILAAEPMTLLHLLSLLLATGLGLGLLLGKKGARTHRILGWIWALLLMVGAISSLFLRRDDVGWSFFHIFSAVTAILLPLALLAARTRRVRWHAALMTYLLVSIVLLAGIFAAYPGFTERLLVQAIFR